MDKGKYRFSYIPELDGIRGFAIFFVMIFHTGIPLFKGGFIGVDIFFVLSGFLICSILLKEHALNHKINLKHFYLRRILRLAPALLLLLAAYFLISYFSLFSQSKANFDSILIALFYSSNWVRAFNLHEMGLLSHTWSLSIEEQFYMLWPALLIVLLRIRSKKTVAIIISLIAISSWILRIILAYSGTAVERLYNGLDTRADALLTGCILAVILSSEKVNIKKQNTRKLVGYMGLLAVVFYSAILFNVSWRNLNMYYWASSVMQVLTAFLILHVICSKDSWITRIFALKPVVWIGSISYGLYLWHDPVFEIMRINGYSQLGIAVIGSLITFSIAVLSYYIIEKPILALKDHLTTNFHEVEIASKKIQEKIPEAVSVKSDI